MNENSIQILPAVALRGITFLPGVVSHFDISRKKSIKAVEHSMAGDRQIFLVTQKSLEVNDPTNGDLYHVGIIAEIKQIVKMQNDVIRVIIEGHTRAKMFYFIDVDGYLEAHVQELELENDLYTPEMEEAMLRSLQEQLVSYASENPKIGKELKNQVDGLTKLETFINILSNSMPIPYQKKQRILEADSLEMRYEILMEILIGETNILQVKNDIQKKVKARVDKNQREYILREQMKVIREELGEDTTDSDIEQFEKATEELEAPDYVKERLKKEISRFRNVSANASESTVVRTYIETLLELPWNKKTEDNTNLKNAEQILTDEHYGLEKVKERVLEFLAVRQFNRGGESPIICLVGPPGTGKTSIARSIARALQKEYVRICLGGVRDEAEIRGHRRTYVGAMPGRIAQGLKSAGVCNPLMLLDEIDKMSSDYKGDTASAMLEVLDSEQNHKFNDHYVDIPIDLSEVLFIATANDMNAIPRPLLDRMEIIEVSSYTANEKFHIAKEHLLEKQRATNGLNAVQMTISDDALRKLITSYTREAGVRNLERRIGELCRKTARKIYDGTTVGVSITEGDLEEYLGKEKYSEESVNEKDEVGIVRGLAWTSVGGVTLQVEVNTMPGKGQLKLTGQLGDVMKESAQAAITYVRSISERFSLDPDYYDKHDFHIHIPEGAVPKDGPSAGITMATALLSAVTGKKVKADVAMTGEITLRGRVLPIGGLKEKLLAAKTAGIKTVCVPDKNRPDVEEISQEIKDGLNICFVEHMDQVLEIALVNA